MSGWDAFISAMQQVGIGGGAIVSLENGAVWGISPGFALGSYALDLPNETETATVRVEIHEVARLLHAVAHEGVPPDDHGTYIGQKKYYLAHYDAEKRSIYYKSKDGYACVAFTGRALVLGAWVGLPPGPCNERVEFLAGELVKSGF